MHRRFMEEYQPHRQVSVDECMILFKGRLGIKQYEKSKPVKFGIKVWMLADSVTGYNYNFEVYCGENGGDENTYPTVGLATRVVLQLTKPLAGEGYTVYTDRFYTSPMLLYSLESRQTYGCGTVMANRKGFPSQLKRDPKDLQHGEMAWLTEEMTDLLATVWQDKKPVYYLSTLHTENADQNVILHNRRGEEIILPAPPCVVDYNQYMGGVDTYDKMTSLDKSRKTYLWCHRLVRKCIVWATYNAYVIEDHFTTLSRQGQRKRDFRSFIIDLTHALIGDFTARRQATPATSDKPTRLQADNHMPAVGEGTDHLCAVCYKKYKWFCERNPRVPYKDVPVKKVKSCFKCTSCDVYLCIKCNSTCWRDYHRKVEYWR
ncbi:piggyBac transposable element-derived protein 4-like [Ptychodera flava]|uniref:piggyBac transposable element-derived protein 4-like n=1 Tax=Ptychodera flava TaxID=63121 RepID=UPI00396A3972